MTSRFPRLGLAAGLFTCLQVPIIVTAKELRTVPSPQAQQKTDALVRQAGQAWLRREWDDFKARFIVEGRVVDNGNGGLSHSEGQGYGMLLAALTKDRAGFEAIWGWTDAHLFVRPDALAAWKWDPATGAVADRNNATDGDLLIAWALVRAAEAFGVPAYAERAKAIGEALSRAVVLKTEAGPVLLPGAFGFAASDQKDGPIVNLSYYVFPAFDALKTVTRDVDWDALRATGLHLIETSRFGPLRLPSDWISLAQRYPKPASGFPKTFGYDAIRIPLYLAWAGSAEAGKARFAGLWNPNPDIGPFVIDTETGAALRPLEGSGFKLVAALSACIAGKGPLPAPTQRRDDFYYPAVLRLLCLAVIEERYPQCL